MISCSLMVLLKGLQENTTLYMMDDAQTLHANVHHNELAQLMSELASELLGNKPSGTSFCTDESHDNSGVWCMFLNSAINPLASCTCIRDLDLALVLQHIKVCCGIDRFCPNKVCAVTELLHGESCTKFLLQCFLLHRQAVL